MIKQLFLPEEVTKDLKHYKTAYSLFLSRRKDEWGNPIPVRVTWADLFRRWMDQAGMFDPEIEQYVAEQKRRNITPSYPTFPIDPTKGEIWALQYVFERDGEELEAHLGVRTPFYAILNGKRVGYKSMLADDWVLLNEVGVEIDDIEVAWTINHIIQESQGR